MQFSAGLPFSSPLGLGSKIAEETGKVLVLMGPSRKLLTLHVEGHTETVQIFNPLAYFTSSAFLKPTRDFHMPFKMIAKVSLSFT